MGANLRQIGLYCSDMETPKDLLMWIKTVTILSCSSPSASRPETFQVQLLPLQCLPEGKPQDPRAVCAPHALRQQPVPRPPLQTLTSGFRRLGETPG